MTAKRRRTLIRNAGIVSLDPDIGDLSNADILIDYDRIAAIGQAIDGGDAEIIDATGMIASPGFVDTHRHVWQTQLKGVAADWSLFDYVCLMRTMYCVSYAAEDAYLGNYVGALEAINAGITTLVDHSHLQIDADFSDNLVKGLTDAAVRGIFCYGVYRNPKFAPGDPKLDPAKIVADIAGPLEDFHRSNAARVRETFFPSNDGLLRFGIASSEYTIFGDAKPVIEELLWSRTLEPARVSIHIGMGINEAFRIVPMLHEQKLLGDDLLFVHGAHLTDTDLRLLAHHGGWLSSTPETELQMGMGFPVVERVLDSGRAPSLGIDIVSNFAGDMFAQMRLMLQALRFRHFESDGGTLPTSPRFACRRILEAATLGGARVLGLDHEIGSISVGKKADIILTRTDGINVSPVNDMVAALVLYADVGDVDSVWVDGTALKRGGLLTGVDWPGLERRLRRSRDAIMERFSQIPIAPMRAAWAPLWGLGPTFEG